MKPGAEELTKNAIHKKKFSKPLMERRRRARINESLNELKSLVLSSLNKDHSKFNKMEKADVLELTVNYLKSLNSNEQHPSNDIEQQQHFIAGYNECAREVQNYLLRSNEVNPQVKARMLSHIAASPTEITPRSPVHSHHSHDELSFSGRKPSFSPLISAYPSPPASPVGIAMTRVPHSPSEASNEFQWTAYLENRAYNAQDTKGQKQSLTNQRLWRPWQSV